MNTQDRIATTEVELLHHENGLLRNRIGHLCNVLQQFVEQYESGDSSDQAMLYSQAKSVLAFAKDT